MSDPRYLDVDAVEALADVVRTGSRAVDADTIASTLYALVTELCEARAEIARLEATRESTRRFHNEQIARRIAKDDETKRECDRLWGEIATLRKELEEARSQMYRMRIAVRALEAQCTAVESE